MEQLQRQQEAKLEMDRQEKHLRQAQMMFIKHVTATRNTGAPLDSTFLGKRMEGTGTGRTPQMGQQQTEAGGSNTNTQSGVDRENGEEGLGGEGSEEDDEEEERMAYEEENSEDDDDDGGHMTKMSPLQQDSSLSSFPLYSTSPSASAKHSAASLPMNLKQESVEKDQSTTEQHSFTSSNGFGDWGFDDGSFKQVSCISPFNTLTLYKCFVVRFYIPKARSVIYFHFKIIGMGLYREWVAYTVGRHWWCACFTMKLALGIPCAAKSPAADVILNPHTLPCYKSVGVFCIFSSIDHSSSM